LLPPILHETARSGSETALRVFRRRTRLSIVDLRADSAAADRGESATFDFDPTDLVFARARETSIRVNIEKGRAAKGAVEAYGG
jgi:hypothetical protein